MGAMQAALEAACVMKAVLCGLCDVGGDLLYAFYSSLLFGLDFVSLHKNQHFHQTSVFCSRCATLLQSAFCVRFHTADYSLATNEFSPNAKKLLRKIP